MSLTVFCLAPATTAVALVDHVRTLGLRGGDLSVVYAQLSGSGRNAPLRTMLDTATTWLLGHGTASRPDIGTLVASGPLLALLSGAYPGSFAAVLGAYGLSGVAASRYANGITSGRILLALHDSAGLTLGPALRLLQDQGATDIHSGVAPRPATNRAAATYAQPALPRQLQVEHTAEPLAAPV